jgi:hypothetical protein
MFIIVIIIIIIGRSGLKDGAVLLNSVGLPAALSVLCQLHKLRTGKQQTALNAEI